jgi:hypothetical protein
MVEVVAVLLGIAPPRRCIDRTTVGVMGAGGGVQLLVAFLVSIRPGLKFASNMGAVTDAPSPPAATERLLGGLNSASNTGEANGVG